MFRLFQLGDFIARFIALRFELFGRSNQLASFFVQVTKTIQIQSNAALLGRFTEELKMVAKIIQVMHGLEG